MAYLRKKIIIIGARNYVQINKEIILFFKYRSNFSLIFVFFLLFRFLLFLDKQSDLLLEKYVFFSFAYSLLLCFFYGRCIAYRHIFVKMFVYFFEPCVRTHIFSRGVDCYGPTLTYSYVIPFVLLSSHTPHLSSHI